jgi:hypothetical protein
VIGEENARLIVKSILIHGKLVTIAGKMNVAKISVLIVKTKEVVVVVAKCYMQIKLHA